MIKQFFLALIIIFLLGSCGEGENFSPATQNPDNDSDKPELQASKSDDDEEVTNPPTLELDIPSQAPQQPEIQVSQACQPNLLNATWICEKGDETHKFFLNRQRFPLRTDEGTEEVTQQVLRVDDPGTERERQRICEIEITISNAEGEFSVKPEEIPHAHWTWGWCVRQLNTEINYIQNQEGFKCEKAGEEFADEEDVKNHNNHCTPTKTNALA